MRRSCHAKYDVYPDTREKWRRAVEVAWTPERRQIEADRVRERMRVKREGRLSNGADRLDLPAM
jgi:hypothetical protein